ncbi:hypothetical protein ABZ354_05640 [Streptomyces sp. NPDC005925]|uniref:hypothetical protein n=1 Tax=Streptomyces sp. NPDC005925 TaxID=3157172 RepID=UPI0033C76CFA
MKSLKAAAVVAGSLVLAGAAAPAFAADAPHLPPTSLSGGVKTLLTEGPDNLMPLQNQDNSLDTENENSVLHTVNGATEKLNSNGGLLGGLPMRG